MSKKKVIFCTYSSIYSSKILEQLIEDTELELVAVINSIRVLHPRYGHIRGSIEQIRTSGLRYSTYLFFITSFFSWMRPLLFMQKWPLLSVHSLAKLNNIPLLDARDINDIQSTDFIKKNSPDYLLCAHFNQLLKQQVLGIEGIECINIHPSLLPAYKGVDPVFFAMNDSQKQIGVSLHRMSPTFDTGETLLQASEVRDKTKSLLCNNCHLFEEGIKLALKWMKNNGYSNVIPEENKDLVDSYDSWPTAKDVRKFRKSGQRLMHISELWMQQ